MIMKNILKIFTAVLFSLIFAGCNEVEINLVDGRTITEIYYTSTDGEVINMYGRDLPIISNTYTDGVGRLILDGEYSNCNRFSSISRLKSIVLPDGIAEIGNDAFEGCINLESITIPGSVACIGDYAFNGCHLLESITIPGSVTSIGKYAFQNCDALASITIPDNIVSFGDCAFQNCDNLVSVTIGKSVTSIGNYAFYGCGNLASVTIGKSVAGIGDYAFKNCYALARITIPDNVTSIGDHAFSDCDNLKSVVIGNGVTSIGSYAFYDCGNLASVTIGSSVASIGSYAFYKCTNLKTIINCSALSLVKGSSSYGYVAYYANSITNLKKEDNNNTSYGHGYVDLGLPSGLKWATCNIGANSPEELGDYYCWGETTLEMVNNTIYVNTGDISGNSLYDAARLQWGGNWRMPTFGEFEELVKNCDWYWVNYNGVDGYRIYGVNNNSIFLPDSDKDYWSGTSSNWQYNYDAAMMLKLESDLYSCYYHAYRSSGRYIRPVTY